MAFPMSIPSAVLGLQSTLNIIVGLYGIFRPTDWQVQVSEQFGQSISRPVAYTLCLQLLNMGISTAFAATREDLHRRALLARLCLHSFAAYIFWDANVKALAVGDIFAAALSALGIMFI